MADRRSLTTIVALIIIGLASGSALAQSAGASGGTGLDGTSGTGGSGGTSGASGQGGIGTGGGGGGGGGSGGTGNNAGLTGGGGGGGGSGGSFVGTGNIFSNSVIVTGGSGGSGGKGGTGAGTNSSVNPPPAGGGGQGGSGGTGGNGLSFTGASDVLTNSADVSGGGGGAGGAGGTGGEMFFGSAGSGGNGGAGAKGGVGVSITATDTIFANSARITGGSGGAGGSGGYGGYKGYIGGANSYAQGGDGGKGGDGGVGLSFVGTGNTFVNTGVVTGGNGGAGGSGGRGGDASSSAFNAQPGVSGAGGTGGAGGAGVVGAGLTIDNTGGTISGGLANGGTGVQANAIEFTGGANGLIVGSSGIINGGIAIGGSLALNPGTAAASATVTLANTLTDYTAPSGTTTTGSVTKAGAGTLTLTGANTYTGGTTFRAGILNVGSAGALGTTGTLSFTGGTLQYSAANQTDYSGRFSTAAGQLYSIDTNGQPVTLASALSSQGGSLTKLGAGTLTLTGANSYTGGTTFAGGILNVGRAGTLGRTGTLSFTGGTLQYSAASQTDYSIRFSTAAGQLYSIDTNGQAVTFASALTSRGGSLTKLGAGMLTLTGTNTYTSATTIMGGTLALSVAGSIAQSSGVALATGGTFDMSGLTNGGTSITSLGNTTTGQTGTVTLGANVLTLTNASGTFGGTIGGTGGLTLTGGTETLTGANTYTGATTISGGTLRGGAANAFSAASATGVATGGTLDLGGFAQTINAVALTGGTLRNGTLTGAVLSTGGTIDGLGGTASVTTTSGTTVATGTNTYTGATTINGGTLQIDGVITASNIIVGNGGTLSGIGKIGDPLIAAGGTLSPGSTANPTGTLTIVGPLTFAVGSYYNVNITPTANSRTNVVGTTTIQGGAVNVAAGQGTYAVRQYTILNATQGVTGTFAGVTTTANFAFLTPSLSYDANNVYLNIAPSNPTPQGTPDYRTAAITQNQLAVAAGLTNAGAARPRGDGGRIVTALNQLTVPQAQAAFDALSGEGLTAAQNIANRSAQLFTSSIFDQTTFYGAGNAANSITLTEPIRELADLPSRAAPPLFVQPNRTWRAWATGFGGVDDIHGNGQIGSSYQQNTIYGGTLGVDYQLTPNYLVGVAIGGTNGDFLVPGRATSGSTTGGHVAFYDLATFGSFYGASSTSFSYFGNRATRTVSGFGGLGTETERANFNSNEFRTRLEFGRHLAGYGGVLTPFVALELAQLRSNGFTESSVQGAGLFRLAVSGQSQASAPAFVGLRLQRATSLGNNITLSPTLQVAYVHEFAPYRSQIGTLADLPGSTFLIDGARPARNAAQVKAGAEMAIGARSMIFANFDGEFSGVNQLYAGKGGFRYVW